MPIYPLTTGLEHRFGDWELNPDASLWRDCLVFLGGRGAGNTAIDSSPRNNACSLVNGTLWSHGHGRSGWQFDGSDDEISGPVLSTLAGSITYAGWEFLTATGSYRGFVDTLNRTTYANGATLVMNGTRLAYYALATGWRSTGVVLATGRWLHIAVAVDATTGGRFYVDGTDVGGWSDPTCHVVAPTFSLRIGKSYSGYTQAGYMQDVGIWNRCLSVSEIRQLASARPDLDGAIRSTWPTWIMSPAAATTNRRRRFLMCAGA